MLRPASEAIRIESTGRQCQARANGADPWTRERERARRRYWLARCPGPGRTLDEIAERTGQPRELLALVLDQETRRPRRRVWRDPLDGRYRLVAGRFDEATLAALARLLP